MDPSTLEACIRNDRKAQYKVYHAYSKAMFNVCLRIINNIEEAEDILQDAFINAFKNMKSFRYESSFGVWLKKIVVNHAINFLNKKRKMNLVPIDQVLMTNSFTETNNKNDEYENLTLEVSKIQKAVQKLPDGYRIVISLYLFEGYNHKEIAKILNISESTSKSQYNRAKKKLRKILTDKEL